MARPFSNNESFARRIQLGVPNLRRRVQHLHNSNLPTRGNVRAYSARECSNLSLHAVEYLLGYAAVRLLQFMDVGIFAV